MSASKDTTTKRIAQKVPLETDQGILESEERKWGLPLKQVYKLSLMFFKVHEGKELQLTYENRLQLVAYTQQAAHGPLATSSAAPLGVLDVIGRDRRAAWQSLGSMSQIQAMAGFVHTIDRYCSLLRPFIEMERIKHEDELKKQMQKAEEERARVALEERVVLESRKDQTDEQASVMQKVKEALNAQTYDQFVQYAAQQYPGNCDQQALLVRQLQEQHFQQYLQQLAVDERLANSQIAQADTLSQDFEKLDVSGTPHDTPARNDAGEPRDPSQDLDRSDEHARTEEEDDEEDYLPSVEEARMWTKPELTQFKESARTGGKLVVGHGETVTVRVPTSSRATSICWEFATDSYDIGFGLYFEWGKPSTSEVTIHVSESDEEDDDDDEEEVAQGVDPELGPGTRESTALHDPKPPVSIIVPIYRRDSHTEVYIGTHKYPGEGVYLLKFDNTYSLWRSKTLYYKVHYYYNNEE